VIGALDEIVDAPLAQQVRLDLLCRSSLAIARALVHPVYAVDALPPARSLEFALDLLLLALLLDLVDALLRALALGYGFLLFIIDGGLVAAKRGVERFLEVEVAPTHLCGGINGCRGLGIEVVMNE
jgi:hypothetical protein